jgi:5-amino-6-(5-phospho-D-ribitylamino)uracil phosphatase
VTAAFDKPALVALDIDGTVIDYAEQMTEEVRAAVGRVVQAGVPVVLATGRSVHGITAIIERLGLPPGHAVASNGAVTFAYPPVEVVDAVTFDARDAVRAVLEHVPDALVAVEVVGRGYRTNRAFPADEITGELWTEPVESLIAEPVTRVIIRDPESSEEDFLMLAQRLGLHGINYAVGSTAWLDLAPAGVSKASALSSLVGSLGIPSEQVLAIGDGRNDGEMLQWAGRGVAMGDAPTEIRALADAVTGSVAENGVVNELDRWFGDSAQR